MDISNLDGLTKLQTRAMYEEAITKVKASDLAVIYFDINNLKNTNDTLGHKFGDKLIIALAEVLKELFRFEEIYRTGGDEFIVLMNGVGENIITKRLESLRSRLKEVTKNDPDGLIYEVACGFCIGDGTMNRETIESEAELRMYSNKKDMKAKNPSIQRGALESTGYQKPAVNKVIDEARKKAFMKEEEERKELLFKSDGQTAVMIFGCISFIVAFGVYLLYFA